MLWLTPDFVFCLVFTFYRVSDLADNELRSDLAKFIAADRIPCTIDRVTGKGVIETNRPDDKNKQYNDVVRQGDQLITKLQKYGQAVRLRGSERA
jgi:26S proteasome regulatory subunit N7